MPATALAGGAASHLFPRSRFNLIDLGIFFAVLDVLQFATNGYAEVFIIGSYHFYFNDLAVLILSLAVARRIFSLRHVSALSLSALVFVLVEVAWIVRGLAVNAHTVFISYRYTAQMPLYFLLFLVLPVSDVNVGKLRWMLAGSVLYIAGLFALRMAFGPGLFMKYNDAISLYLQNGRSLDAYSTFSLGCISIYFLDLVLRRTRTSSSRLYATISTIAFVVILLTRQRSATLATIVGFGIYLACMRGSIRRIPAGVVLAGAALGAVAIFLLLIGLQSDIFESLPAAFRQSATDESTLFARQEYWAAAWHEFLNRDLLAACFGYYAGYAVQIYTTTGVWLYSLHSQFVQTLSNLGIFGTASFAIVPMIGAVAALRASAVRSAVNGIGLSGPVAIAWISMSLVIGYTYEWFEISALFPTLACVPWAYARGTQGRMPQK